MELATETIGFLQDHLDGQAATGRWRDCIRRCAQPG